MIRLNNNSLGTFMRGDSAIIPWSWKKRSSEGQLTPISLVGYKASMTIKSNNYDLSADDQTPDEMERTTAKGYNNTFFKIDVDCDNPTQMHNIAPAKGEIQFHLPKQATWVEPGKYVVDIVVQNKASKWTTTVFSGTLEIVGHPTNRLTTDGPDSWRG